MLVLLGDFRPEFRPATNRCANKPGNMTIRLEACTLDKKSVLSEHNDDQRLSSAPCCREMIDEGTVTEKLRSLEHNGYRQKQIHHVETRKKNCCEVIPRGRGGNWY